MQKILRQMLIFASFILSNAWVGSNIPVPIVRDINGVAINIGSTVKILGVVIGMVPYDGMVILQLQNPNPSTTSKTLQLMSNNLIVGS